MTQFTSSGREDLDVRMLGDGRPFVIEVINPRNTRVTQAEIDALQDHVNSSKVVLLSSAGTSLSMLAHMGHSPQLVGCKYLRVIEKKDFSILKDGEESKKKAYR